MYFYLLPIQQNDKTTTNNLKKKVKIFKKTFFPAPPNANLTYIQDFIYLTKIDIPAIADTKIENVIFRPVLNKTPGIDGISNWILGKIISLILQHLHKVFHDCVNLAYYSHHFKKSITIVLQKPSSEKLYNYTSARAYRLIALLNTLGKALESVLATRLSYLVETYELLPHTNIGRKISLVYQRRSSRNSGKNLFRME